MYDATICMQFYKFKVTKFNSMRNDQKYNLSISVKFIVGYNDLAVKVKT